MLWIVFFAVWGLLSAVLLVSLLWCNLVRQGRWDYKFHSFWKPPIWHIFFWLMEMWPDHSASCVCNETTPALKEALSRRFNSTAQFGGSYLQGQSHRTFYVLDKPLGTWFNYVSAYVWRSDPTAQFSCVPVMRKQLLVATTVYFCESVYNSFGSHYWAD